MVPNIVLKIFSYNPAQAEGFARISDGLAVVSIITLISNIMGYFNFKSEHDLYLLIFGIISSIMIGKYFRRLK